MKDIDEYGRFTEEMWFTHPPNVSLTIMALGLSGEVGEVQEHLKKYFRDGRELNMEALVKELGDVAYYWARLCMHLGLKPSEVLAANVNKLTSRQSRGTLAGSGNNR